MYLPLRPRLKFNYREASSGEYVNRSQHTDDTAITNLGEITNAEMIQC